ncbi:DEKNAAC104490 [Brettanomyces naardenensis]|uniref:DEKNAAC104490 n=1 Tax=Brettanomyces naardenensis TaxID=13370 RepID=A0A448YRM9_BRENA|nr:DEKNAAC104490 [Brettanomyces naardenensis]
MDDISINSSDEDVSSLGSTTPSESLVEKDTYKLDREVHPLNSKTAVKMNRRKSSSLFRTMSNNIISRTSSIVEAVKDDSQYAAERDRETLERADYGAEVYAGSIMREPIDLEKDADESETEKQQMDTPPDGTFWGWTTCICVMLINTFSWGTNTVYGVFLEYYVSSNHFPGANMEEYSLIGGLCLGMSFMFISVANTLIRRFHYKSVMLFGTAIIVICFCTASVATSIVQLVMLQGFLMSIGFALTAGPTFVMIPSWFLKKRSVAQGIGAAGVGLAGVIFSKPIELMIQNGGNYRWALRMLGIVCGVMLTISIALVRTRRPLQVKNDSLIKAIWQNFTRWDILFRSPMMCVIMWNCIYGLAFAVLLFSFSSYSTAIGLTRSQGSMVTLVQSIAQTLGRPVLGIMSDRWGRANTTILSTTFLGIISLVWWTFIKSYPNLLVFSFITGFFMGISWVNFTPLCADVVGGGDDLLAAVSLLTFIGGIPQIVAEIIGLKLKRPEMSQPFLYCQILVGIACILSAAILLPFREWKIKKFLTVRKDLIEDDVKRSEKDEIRLRRYELMLERTFRGRLIRMFYPMKV